MLITSFVHLVFNLDLAKLVLKIAPMLKVLPPGISRFVSGFLLDTD